jgi:hypothetical protein
LLILVFPFVVLALPEEHYNALHTEVTSGHHAVEHIGEFIASVLESTSATSFYFLKAWRMER